MSPTKAQNRIRKQYGIGFDGCAKRRMHELVDQLAADALIATAYREAEKKERDERHLAENIDRYGPVARSIGEP